MCGHAWLGFIKCSQNKVGINDLESSFNLSTEFSWTAQGKIRYCISGGRQKASRLVVPRQKEILGTMFDESRRGRLRANIDHRAWDQSP